jgi:hypothetical protein
MLEFSTVFALEQPALGRLSFARAFQKGAIKSQFNIICDFARLKFARGDVGQTFHKIKMFFRPLLSGV